MLWNVECKPQVSYNPRELRVNQKILPLTQESPGAIKIHNIGVKNFRSLLCKKKNSSDFVVFQVRQISSMATKGSDQGLKPIDDELMKLNNEFASVFRSELPEGLPPKRDVDHKIEVDTDAKRPHRGIYQLSPAELLATREYITDLLKKKKIRPSMFPYGAPPFFVKQNGQLRGVIDYWALNRIVMHNNSPIPRTDEIFDRLGQATFFSKLDLKTGFHQIRIVPGDIGKTVFKTKYGHFEFLVMSMGLKKAPDAFQAPMNSIFRDCIDDFIVVYLDDILIFSETKDEHLKHLRIVLSRLREQELYVGNNKFELMKSGTEFLGLMAGKDGIRVGEDRKKLIKDWPIPDSITALRSFLGLVQFFRSFVKDFSRIATPLTSLTRNHSNIGKWNGECDYSFNALKTALVLAPIMAAPDWTRAFRWHTDSIQLNVGRTFPNSTTTARNIRYPFFKPALSGWGKLLS